MPKRRDLLALMKRKAAVKKRFDSRQILKDRDVVRAALPVVDARFVRETRENLNCSRALFARRLCMNERTLEKWEQGRAQPNSQAAILFLLVRHFPDTLERMRRIAYPDPVGKRQTPS
jgi:putative transcriptional regulator